MNLQNTLRRRKHNAASDIQIHPLTSRLIPLANHEVVSHLNYMEPLDEMLREVGDFAKKNDIRIDFHPDHFVLINSLQKHILKFYQNATNALFIIKGDGH